MTLILNNAQIAELVSMQDCVDVLEDAFLELAEGRGAFRRRSDICTPSTHPSGGIYALKSMDGVVPKLGVGAIRLNSDILTFPTVNDTLRRVKIPAARSFTTSSQGKCVPFIAIHTPAGSTCANEMALPRLKRPSELPKAYGTMAPVRTTVVATPTSSIVRTQSAISCGVFALWWA